MFGRICAGAGALALVAGLASSAMAQESFATTKAQCEALWKQALAGASGDLAMDKAKPFVTDFSKADKNADGKLTQVEWLDACGDRLIHAKAATGSATTGAGSGETSDRTPGESSSPDRPTPSRPY